MAVVGLILWGVWFFALSGNSGSNTLSNPNASLPSVSPVQSQTQAGTSVSVQSISSPQNSEVAKDFLNNIQNSSQIALGGTVVASPYALQIWGDANKGGEALLKYSSSAGWTLISLGGGQWTVIALVQEGVPVAVAKELVAGLTNGTALSPATSTLAIPTGNTLMIGTSKGGVVMNNFYLSAAYIAQEQQAVVIQQTSTYDIIYSKPDSSFVITIFGMPYDTALKTAESAFLDSLSINQQDACKLNVVVLITGQTAASNLSFCAGAIK